MSRVFASDNHFAATQDSTTKAEIILIVTVPKRLHLSTRHYLTIHTPSTFIPKIIPFPSPQSLYSCHLTPAPSSPPSRQPAQLLLCPHPVVDLLLRPHQLKYIPYNITTVAVLKAGLESPSDKFERTVGLDNISLRHFYRWTYTH